MLRRHTYENMVKRPSSGSKPLPPSLQPLFVREGDRPSSEAVGTPPSLRGRGGGGGGGGRAQLPRRDYENVVLPGEQLLDPLPDPLQDPPQYEEIMGSGQAVHSVNPLYGRGRISSAGSTISEPFSPSPALPDRKYSDSDLMSPSPGLPEGAQCYTPPGSAALVPPEAEEGLGSRKMSVESHHHVPLHQISETGSEYAIVSRNHNLKKRQSTEEGAGVGVGSGMPPPIRPLRARERMSRENLVAAASADTGTLSEEVGVAEEGSAVSDKVAAQAPKQAYQQHQIAYSIVKLDSVTGKSEVTEEEVSQVTLPTSPQPYEVASPTTSTSALQGCLPLTGGGPVAEPHYEEIESGKEPGQHSALTTTTLYGTCIVSVECLASACLAWSVSLCLRL